MAQPPNSTLANIRDYAVEARRFHAQQMEYDATGTEARLEQTVQELQARVREQQAALEEV